MTYGVVLGVFKSLGIGNEWTEWSEGVKLGSVTRSKR